MIWDRAFRNRGRLCAGHGETGKREPSSGSSGQTVALSPASSGSLSAKRSLAAASSVGTSASTTTKPNGFFGLTVKAGKYQTSLAGRSATGQLIPHSYSLAVSSVDLTNGKYAPMRLRVPGVSLHLVNGHGKPVPGVVATTGCLQTAQQLFAGGAATGTVCGRATSDSLGRVKLALLPISTTISVHLTPSTASGYCSRSVQGVKVPTPSMVRVTLRPGC